MPAESHALERAPVHPQVQTALPADGMSIPSRTDPEGRPSYYNVSLLKAPVWKWQIAGYFFFGGISGGSYILSRLGELFGNGRSRDLTASGARVAFMALLPCAPLLIHDLGDPRRFYHMLRIFKPGSPMSLGTWVLTAFSGVAGLAILREKVPPSRSLGAIVRHPATRIVLDAAGIPLGLLLVGYTGVLLSCTANPLWCRNWWLGPLFTASSFANSASGASLLLESTGSKATRQFLANVATAAHVTEMVCLAGYQKERGRLAKPLGHGTYGRMITLATAGLVLSEVLKRLPLKGKAKTVASIAGSVAGLASGLMLRTALVYGGQPAANDPDLARQVTGGATERGALPHGASLSNLELALDTDAR